MTWKEDVNLTAAAIDGKLKFDHQGVPTLDPKDKFVNGLLRDNKPLFLAAMKKLKKKYTHLKPENKKPGPKSN